MPSALGGIFNTLPEGFFFRHYEGTPKSPKLFYDPDITRAFKKSLEYISYPNLCQTLYDHRGHSVYEV
jgi:hypothetical protein